MNKKIFAIDDEQDILEIIKINLKNAGYHVYCFSSAELALQELKKVIPGLIILDIMMEGIDGYEFCKQLKAIPDYKNIPIIFLTAKSEEFDKILGLELGGDDYITKPFSIKELKSRIKAVMRRTVRILNGEKPKIVAYKGIELNSDFYVLTVDGQDVPLTKTEFGILELFLKHPGKIFTRDNIIDSIKGHDVYVIDRTIDVHVMNIRKKLGKYKNIITTFSGVGYGFKE